MWFPSTHLRTLVGFPVVLLHNPTQTKKKWIWIVRDWYAACNYGLEQHYALQNCADKRGRQRYCGRYVVFHPQNLILLSKCLYPAFLHVQSTAYVTRTSLLVASQEWGLSLQAPQQLRYGVSEQLSEYLLVPDVTSYIVSQSYIFKFKLRRAGRYPSNIFARVET